MKKLVVILFCLFTTSVFSQDTQWMRDLSGQASSVVRNYISVDDNNDYYSLITLSQPPPTITLGGSVLTFSSGSTYETLLIKYDDSGKVIWAKNSYSLNSGIALQGTHAHGMTSDGSNVYLCMYSFNDIIFNNDTLKKSATNHITIFLIKLDVSGNQKWIRKMSLNDRAGLSTESEILYRKPNNDIIISFSCKNNTSGAIFSDDSAFSRIDLPSANNGFLFNFDTDGNFKKVKQTFSHNILFTSIASTENGKIMIGGTILNKAYSTGMVDTIVLNNITSALVLYDSSLNFEYLFDKQSYPFSSISSVKNTFYVLCGYAGAITTKDTVISGAGEGMVLYKVKDTILENATYFNCINGCYGLSGGVYPSSRLRAFKEILYINIGTLTANYTIQYLNQNIPKYNVNDNAYLIKLDTLYNLLWAFTYYNIFQTSSYSDIMIDKYSDLLVSWNYANKLVLFNDSLNTGTKPEYFLAKITDYSITRGEVFAGPYCAGDSMDIPYTRKGTYNPDNWFIAQLSDEHGNFDDTTKIRELGRLQTTEDSTIRGALPLFQVSSSGNYRIRVISTSPPVQSFYKEDSLRLLIYSTDKADPGPSETVCLGDSLQLYTFGGTAWEWSPAFRMDDSSSRTPWIYAEKDTVFRIVISDSSGCGEPDTAFKQIYVRSNPKIIARDSFTACLNEEVPIHASFSGGDSTGYNWTWYNIPRPGDWRAVRTDSFDFADTFFYKHTSQTRNLTLVLDDGCSFVKDTAYFSVVLHSSRTKGKITTPDSLQCYGSAVDLFGSIYGGDSTTYSWEWFEIDERNLPHFLSSGNNKFADTINVQLGKNVFDYKRFAFVTKDECLPYIDSSFIDLKIDRRVPQAVILPSDTAICPSTSAEISAQISSGSGKGFRWKWIDEKGNILSQDSGNVFETSVFIKPNFINETDSQKFWFIVEDICSPESDTQAFVISPLPPIKLIPNTFDTTICYKQLLNLSAIGSGGTASNFLWNWRVIDPIGNVMLMLKQVQHDNQHDSLLDYLPPSNLRKLLITLSLTDGCMEKGDSVSINLTIRDPLQAEILDFTNNPAQDTSVCSGSDLKFFANGTGGIFDDYKFTWLLDDDEISTDDFVEINSKDFKNLNAVLTLILSDDCSVMADTQQIDIQTLPELKAEFSAPDTLCFGEEISLLAQGTGGISNQYQFTWLHKKDDGSLEILGSGNTLNLNSKKLVSANDFNKFNKREILLVLTDNCSSPNDTFSKKIIIRPELSLSLSSSTICANPDALLTANPKGGNPNSHQIFWYDESNNFLGNGLTKTVNPLGFDKFTAILKDACSSDSAKSEIQIDRIPDLLLLNSNPAEGCQPLPVTFEPQTDYPDKYNFVLNLGNNDSANISEGTANYEYVYTSYGTYTPTLKIKTQSGCEKQIVGTPITVYPKPTAAYTYDPENPDMDNPFVNFINQSTGATDYIWTLDPYGDFFESDPIIEYKDTGYHNIRLISISEHDCRDTTESIIYIKTNYRVFLPSAFSPNGDGLNDDFKPSVRGFSELDFRVYNRWGELIFRSTKDEAWDGTYNGIPMPEGVYAFTLNVISANGEKQFFRGTVTMMR